MGWILLNSSLIRTSLKYLAELIENQVSKKSTESADSKPSKMDIMVEILKRLFPHITETELDACRGIVNFLVANKLIKKVALSKIMKFYLKQKVFLKPLKILMWGSSTILYNRYVSTMLNSYQVTNIMLEQNGQISVLSQANLIQQYVLFPVLMGLVKHKVAVLIILAFI